MTASEAAAAAGAAQAATIADNTNLLEDQITQAASTGAYTTIVYTRDNPAYVEGSAFMTPANKFDLEFLGFTVTNSTPNPGEAWYYSTVSWANA